MSKTTKPCKGIARRCQLYMNPVVDISSLNFLMLNELSRNEVLKKKGSDARNLVAGVCSRSQCKAQCSVQVRGSVNMIRPI